MKHRYFVIILTSLLLISCNETPLPDEALSDALSSTSQPIINGHLATYEAHTVALIKVPGDESVMDYYSLCPDSGQRSCQTSHPGSSVACLMDYSGTWCPNTCRTPGTTGYKCYDDEENDYSYLYPFRCVNYDGTYVWTSDYYDGPRIICENGCNASGDGCDSYGVNQHRPCPSGYTCSDPSALCLFSNGGYKCVLPCSYPGAATHSCDCYEYDYGEICYETINRCTAVDYNGTTQYVNLFESENRCSWGCSGNTCNDYASTFSYTPVPGGVAADSFCSGTLIHPQWVLTAAHCIVDSDDHTKYSKTVLKTRIGIGSDTRSILSFPPDEFNQFYYHDKYKTTSTYAGDIALIRLRDPIPASIATPVPPLPPWLAFNSDDLPLAMRTSGFGYDEYGMSDRRLTVDLTTTGYCGIYNRWDGEECYVGTVSYSGCHPNPAVCSIRGPANVTNKSVTIPAGMIYAPLHDNGQCSGDSGGPTYYEVGGKEYVAGVTSYGDSQCRGYNVSTAVADYYDWIIGIAPEVASQYVEICGNGIDDDGNGRIDSEDSSCSTTTCGNHRLDVGEVCDGDIFATGSQTCQSWSSSYASGNLQCNHCNIDLSRCVPVAVATCGNGRLDSGETCDGNLFAGGRTACSAWDEKYGSGTVSCNHCTIDESRCVEKPACGNGVLDGGEACDGTLFAGGKTLCSAWDSKYMSGNVSCQECALNYTDCVEKPYCGNGVLDEGETCDGNLFAGGQTACSAWDEAYQSGSVACHDCVIDPTNCVSKPTCGNGVVDSGEACDGTLFAGGKTLCSAWDSKYMSGNVSCQNCALNYADCVEKPYCGNGLLDEGEVCDGNLFADKKVTCSAWDEKYQSGNVACNHCEIDYTNCVAKPTCGNGVLDGGEACDATLFAGGKTLCSAWDAKYMSGNVSCQNCALDYTACVEKPYCGNGLLDEGEVCDGKLFAGGNATCSAWDPKYMSGNISCNKCTPVYTNCVVKPACGNGLLDRDEACDGTLLAGGKMACKDWDSLYISGNVSCNSDCTLDVSQCEEDKSSLCHNGLLDSGEVCDGILFADGKTACSAWNEKYISGSVSCHNCSINYNNCVVKPACGNGILDDGEACEGELFAGGKTRCSAWDDKYNSGTVSCHDCAIDYSQCVEKPYCGNGILDNDEACDGSLFAGGKTMCSAWDPKYISGSVSCNRCQLDYSRCVAEPSCGNGILDNSEACDGSRFAGGKKTCREWDSKYESGNVSCQDCAIDYSQCEEKPSCGNGILDEGEACDGTLFIDGKAMCSAWDERYLSGKVFCTKKCVLDFNSCEEKPACGNGILDRGEACDENLFNGGKTSCNSWDKNYISGSVSCNHCAIDYSQCEEGPKCGNGILDLDEACDGSHFAEGKKTCRAWDQKYISGDVTCFYCSVDFSECKEAEHGEASGCSASPLRHSQPPYAVLLLLGIGFMLRRRKTHEDQS